MTKFYNEPEFKVIVSMAEDVITTSGEETPTITQGQFETEDFNFSI